MREEILRNRITEALTRRAELNEEVAKDVGFHMADWLNDLQQYAAFCAAPDDWSDEQIADLLMRFLIHVPAHVNAAAKLYADCVVEDVFEVGILRSDDA